MSMGIIKGGMPQAGKGFHKGGYKGYKGKNFHHKGEQEEREPGPQSMLGPSYLDPVHRAQIAELQAKNHSALLDELLPLVSGIIDSNGGVMRIDTIGFRSTVRNLLNKIQPPYQKSLPDLLAEWTDFFHIMPEGLVGTNAGYDSGLITSEGALNADYIWKFVSPSTNKEECPTMADEKIVSAADDLFHAIMDLSSEEPLLVAFNMVKQTRATLTGKEPIPALRVQNHRRTAKGARVKLQSADGAIEAMDLPPEQKQEFIVRQIANTMRDVPGKCLQMSQIFADAGSLKDGIFIKSREFLERYPSLFAIQSIDGSPNLAVTLIDDGTDDIPDPLPQQAVKMNVWGNKKAKYNNEITQY